MGRAELPWGLRSLWPGVGGPIAGVHPASLMALRLLPWDPHPTVPTPSRTDSWPSFGLKTAEKFWLSSMGKVPENRGRQIFQTKGMMRADKTRPYWPCEKLGKVYSPFTTTLQFLLVQRTNPVNSPNEQALESLVSTCHFEMVICPPPFTQSMAESPAPNLSSAHSRWILLLRTDTCWPDWAPLWTWQWQFTKFHRGLLGGRWKEGAGQGHP